MKKIEPILRVGFTILISIFLCINIYNFVQKTSVQEIIEQVIGWTIYFAIFIVIIILMIRFPILARLFEAAFERYMRFIFWYFCFFLPFLPFWVLYKLSWQLPIWLQVLMFILWGVCLFAALWALILEKNRNRLFTWLRKRVGTHAPLAYSFNLMWIGGFFFASLTYILVQSGILPWVVPIGQNISLTNMLDFYLWHFLDALPVFKITNTLLWKEPLTYDSSWVGLLLLLFKIIVISPIIGAFIWYWKFIGQENKSEGEEKTKVQVRKRMTRTYHRKSKASS